MQASLTINENWYLTASATYLPLKTNATASSVAANGQTVLSNKTHITANPWVTLSESDTGSSQTWKARFPVVASVPIPAGPCGHGLESHCPILTTAMR
jgi:hypothetical protein